MSDSWPYNEFGDFGLDNNPGRPTLVATGYDKHSYIATAALMPSAYTTQSLIETRLGGQIKLIEACDDSTPPIGDMTGAVLDTFNNILQTVATEINGYLSSVYPMPLAQTGTVAILKVSEVDDNGGVTAVEVLVSGNYQTAPNTSNNPAYLHYVDPVANEYYWGLNWEGCHLGTGLVLTVAYADSSFADESGSVATAKKVSGTPTIATAGTGYQAGELIVLTGGSSFVPAKIREAMQVLVCHSLYNRRLSSDEKNNFADLAKFWRKTLVQIGESEIELDGTFKRSFSAGSSWNTRSVLYGANSL